MSDNESKNVEEGKAKRTRKNAKRDARWNVVDMRKRQKQYNAYATEKTPVGKYYGTTPEGKAAILNRQFIVEFEFTDAKHRDIVADIVNAKLDAGEKISVAAAVRQTARENWPDVYGQPAQQSSKIATARAALKELANADDEAAKLAALAALAASLGVSLEATEATPEATQ